MPVSAGHRERFPQAQSVTVSAGSVGDGFRRLRIEPQGTVPPACETMGKFSLKADCIKKFI